MSATELDELLARMPAIAAAVGKFSSENVQMKVFDTLMHTFGADTLADGAGVTEHEDEGAPPVKGARGAIKKVKKVQAVRKSPGAKAKRTYTFDKNLDLVRGGTKSFKAFVSEKQPSSLLEKGLVCVYWLTKLAKASAPATVDQVYTCFKHMEWPVPPNLANTLAQAGTKGWLDTSKGDDLHVVIAGENHVEHEMPASKS